MNYYLDTEFNGFGGELISLALVRHDGESLYLVYPEPRNGYKSWVWENVVPILWSIPSPLPGMAYKLENKQEGALRIAEFLKNDPDPMIITDWPDDIKYFCNAVITGPGTMANIPRFKFDMNRVDAYPTTLPGAVQHNAWWDARALWWYYPRIGE
jgi:hypothetical protein